MTVLFDANFLVRLFDPQIYETKCEDPRFTFLHDTLTKNNQKIIVPTPALSELLIGAGDNVDKYLSLIRKSNKFQITPFNERAAIEAAEAHREAIQRGDKRDGSETKTKLKFDRQIVAIAKVFNASTIYSEDKDIKRYGERAGIKVMTSNELPLPPEIPQRELQF